LAECQGSQCGFGRPKILFGNFGQTKQNTDSVFAMLSKADMFDVLHMTKVKDESARSAAWLIRSRSKWSSKD
jgi:xanthine dehydrogenase iron-sulfur cluster and FAD-binding subunit A